MEAANNLITSQKQLDMDGVMVGVSRQALEEVLASHAELVEALKGYREALMMGPLDIAAKFGPDFNPDDILIEADKKAVAALSKAGV